MSNNFRFELNRAGVGELLKSSAMRDCLMERANEIATNAGVDYKAKNMGTRVIVVGNEKATADNYKNNTLLKKGGI